MTTAAEKDKDDRLWLVNLDCSHSQIMKASELSRNNNNRTSSRVVCRDCYTRKDGSCSIDPVHRIVSAKEVPSYMSKKIMEHKHNNEKHTN